MKFETVFLAAAIGLSLDCGTLAAAPAEAKQPASKAKVRVYTNDDLDRIHPLAGQTGGGSTAPGEVVEAAEPEPRTPGGKKGGEAYWRAEAARVEERARALEERARALRARIAEENEEARRRSRDVVYGRRHGASKPARSTAPLEAALASVERRIREVRGDLEERARRARALPGWLR